MQIAPLYATAITLLVAMALAPGAAHAQAVSAGPVDPKIIEDLVAANRILVNEGVLDAFGHVSIRHPGNPERFLMGRNLAPALVKPEDIVEYDLDGNAINAPPNATHFLERFIHGEMYRKRADVGAVVHSHSPSVIPFGVTQQPMRPLYHMSSFLAPGVPVFEIRKVAGMSNMLIANGALGKALAETLGDKNVALMRGHGDVVVAKTLPMAVFRAVYTEVNARLQFQAMMLGGPITFLEPEEGEKAMQVMEAVHLRAWDIWKRTALAQMAK
jgi:HCOMODA/2-hydroxy-3-carboxy-muconic semialdehyde decarboxylase